VHQPSRQVLTAISRSGVYRSGLPLAALLGNACTTPASPDGAPPPAPPSLVEFEQTRAEPCGPGCEVELWQADGEQLRVEIRPRAVRAPDRWMRGWPGLRGPLGACLGDPLARPPAGDPEGLRQLVRVDGQAWWWIRLSGANRCALSGELALAVDRDRAQTDALSVGGLPWSEGGRAAATRALRAEARALPPAAWAAMDPEDRAWLELALDAPLGPAPPSGPHEGPK